MNTKIIGLDPDEVKGYQLRYPVDVLYGDRWVNTNRQRSRIVPMAKGGLFLVTKDARLANPVSLRLDGVWSHHRVANELPANYSLEK
ncbi:MAG: hypothetical protein R3220_11960 [Balneolaceae bacterium]|nr:hypothetical protein [Balneolaceae bacterium]